MSNLVDHYGAYMFILVIISLKIKSLALKFTNTIEYKYFSKEMNCDCLVVDCTHSTADQLTHHLKKQGQKELVISNLRGDSSTDAVFNAILNKHSVLNKHFVSSNHWDIDSFLSVWCCMNNGAARANEIVLRECARIGDFRELRLEESFQHTALQLACWLNSEERRLFHRPFESSLHDDANEDLDDAKFTHFLRTFTEVLKTPMAADVALCWRDEYSRVVSEYDVINGRHSTSSSTTVRKFPPLGLVVVTTPTPMHYYSLFSVTRGYDIVLSCYDGNKYELEQKYTTYVDLVSRPCLPRVELQPLARLLNRREDELAGREGSGEVGTGRSWGANRITDTGPVLRIDTPSQKLSRAERYGHPYERPIFPSRIPRDEFVDTVIRYLAHAYGVDDTSGDSSSITNITPKKDWEWSELHEFNGKIDWSKFV